MTEIKRSDIQVMGYSIEFDNLTLKMQKDLPELYDFGLFYAKHLQIKKGFYAYKVNKATKKGTKLKCKPLTSDNISEILEDHQKEFEKVKEREQDFMDMLTTKLDKIKENL